MYDENSRNLLNKKDKKELIEIIIRIEREKRHIINTIHKDY